MNLFTLIAICFGVFGLFAITEVNKLKKEVRRLNGIVTYLLDEKKSQNGD